MGIMEGLKNKLTLILDFIQDKNDVVFLDYPLHYNVGDLLILKGTLSFFEDNGVKIKKHYSAFNADINKVKEFIGDKTTILFHGGGNFGDIYDIHQRMRENYISFFKENTIIILPQTAYFKNVQSLNESKKIFNSHKKIIMFARDEISYDIFKSFSKHSYLIPDMAHQLYGEIPINKKKNKDVLYFLRKDVEINPTQTNFIEKNNIKDVYDWGDFISFKHWKVLSFINKLIALNRCLKSSMMDSLIFKIWVYHTNTLIDKFSVFFFKS